ncbi:MAG: hypothetical protein AcusKO_46010 [Acuticoccus sp.]
MSYNLVPAKSKRRNAPAKGLCGRGVQATFCAALSARDVTAAHIISGVMSAPASQYRLSGAPRIEVGAWRACRARFDSAAAAVKIAGAGGTRPAPESRCPIAS